MQKLLNLPPDAEERLRRQAHQTGISPEEADRKIVEAAQHPPDSLWEILGFIVLLWLQSNGPSPEAQKAISEAFQPYVDSLLKNGSEQQLAALLPKLPREEAEPVQASPLKTKRTLRGYGLFAHSPRSVEAFEREGREEMSREEREFHEAKT